MPKAVFDIISKDPQIEHIANQVHPTAVHEHTGKNVHYFPKVDAFPQSGWNERVLVKDLVDPANIEEHPQKDQHIDRDQQVVNDGGFGEFDFVTNGGDHVFSVY